jgi:spore coat protein CotH
MAKTKRARAAVATPGCMLLGALGWHSGCAPGPTADGEPGASPNASPVADVSPPYQSQPGGAPPVPGSAATLDSTPASPSSAQPANPPELPEGEPAQPPMPEPAMTGAAEPNLTEPELGLGDVPGAAVEPPESLPPESLPPESLPPESLPPESLPPESLSPEPPDNDELYDPEHIPRFDIALPEDSLAQLGELTQGHPLAREYVRATFRYEEEVLVDIGVRLKGEGSWRPLDQKSAWKLKFDEFVDGQALRGLKRLTLNNMVEDPSFLAERLAYHVYRQAGLPAPRCNSALVYVNDEFYGVYANIEAVDKPFLRRWFEEDQGNLYEEGQSDFVPGSEESFDLETNKTANDRSDLTLLIETLEAVREGAPWSDLETIIDGRQFLLFTAAEAAVNQWDMYGYTRFYPNNFRFYHDPVSGQFAFLPWGMDLSMKPFRDSGKPHIPLFELARQGDFESGRVVAGQLYQTCLLDEACRARFVAASEDMIAVYESLDLEILATRYAEQLRPHIEADPQKEYTMAEVDAGIQATVDTIRSRAQAMRADLQAAE